MGRRLRRSSSDEPAAATSAGLKGWLNVLRQGLMILERPGSVSPDWEPVPWDAGWRTAKEQRKGFHQRARKPLVWTRVDRTNFPESGIFGRDREWFIKHDIACISTFDDEDLVLISHAWSGFPDPPQWSVASRPAGNADARWERWGSFPDLPAAWIVPDRTEPGRTSLHV